jgi:hypothetical protein
MPFDRQPRPGSPGPREAGGGDGKAGGAAVELAVSALRPAPMEWASGPAGVREAHWLRTLDDPDLARWLAGLRPTHLYIGSELCEHLLPSPILLRRALERARDHALRPALLTPVASPGVIDRLPALLDLLPENAELIVNDWGVAGLAARCYPGLRRAAGRLLCRMVKDPRLPGAEWAPQCGYGFDSAPMQAVFARLGLERLEMDAPMFPAADAFSRLPLAKSVHVPYACVAKGRMCRIGSIALPETERFSVGRSCRKECLKYTSATRRPRKGDRQDTVHAGNAIFARHSGEMLAAVMQATARGEIERLVVPGAGP